MTAIPIIIDRSPTSIETAAPSAINPRAVFCALVSPIGTIRGRAGIEPDCRGDTRWTVLAELGRSPFHVRSQSGLPPLVRAGKMPSSRSNGAMFEGLTRREIVIIVMALIAVVLLTIEGTYYGLHKFILDNPNDPLTRQGGLKPDQQTKKPGL
jgi:hypothetical protein